MGLISDSRKKEILEFLQNQPFVLVNELAQYFNISPLTVRRDLDALAKNGLIIRTHGGAKLNLLPTGLVNLYREVDFEDKSIINIPEKKIIGEMAQSFIEDDSIVFMNGGSTTLFFLQALKSHRLQVLTNNAAAFCVGCHHTDANVALHCLGGEYRCQSKSFIGNMTVNSINSIHSNYTVLGTNGIDLVHGLSTSVYEDCFTNQAMVDHTLKKVIVLADYSKFGVVSNFISVPLSKIDIIVTDNKCPEEYIVQLREKNIEVIIAT